MFYNNRLWFAAAGVALVINSVILALIMSALLSHGYTNQISPTFAHVRLVTTPAGKLVRPIKTGKFSRQVSKSKSSRIAPKHTASPLIAKPPESLPQHAVIFLKRPKPPRTFQKPPIVVPKPPKTLRKIHLKPPKIHPRATPAPPHPGSGTRRKTRLAMGGGTGGGGGNGAGGAPSGGNTPPAAPSISPAPDPTGTLPSATATTPAPPGGGTTPQPVNGIVPDSSGSAVSTHPKAAAGTDAGGTGSKGVGASAQPGSETGDTTGGNTGTLTGDTAGNGIGDTAGNTAGSIAGSTAGAMTGNTAGAGAGNGRGVGKGGGGPFGVGAGAGEGARHIVYLLDMSPSMESRITRAKQELRDALGTLQRNESFDIIAFSADRRRFSEVVKPPQHHRENLIPATPDRVTQAVSWMTGLDLWGGTDLEKALRGALRMRDVNVIVLITDGVPTVGETNFSRLARHIQDANRDDHARIYTVGLVGARQPESALTPSRPRPLSPGPAADPEQSGAPAEPDHAFEAETLLKDLAEQSGGAYKQVTLGVDAPEAGNH